MPQQNKAPEAVTETDAKKATSMLMMEKRYKQLLKERDRYVAFAFCSSDLLLELDREYRIVAAAGATQDLLGGTAKQVVGHSLAELIGDGERASFLEKLHKTQAGTPMKETEIILQSFAGQAHHVTVNGYTVKRLGNNYYLGIRPVKRRHAAAVKPSDETDVPQQAAAPAMETDGFQGQAGGLSALPFAQRIGDFLAKEDQNTTLSFINFENALALKDRLSARQWQKLNVQITTALQKYSVNGDMAGQFSEERYGILHERKVNLEKVIDYIERQSQQVDPQREGLIIRKTPLALSNDLTENEESARALVYTIKNMADSPDTSLDVNALTSGLKEQMEKTQSVMTSVKAVIHHRLFDVAYQPIVSLKDGQCHHYEALVRLHRHEVDMNPFEFIKFSEETGVITDFDIAMCREVVDRLADAVTQGPVMSVALNMSGYSLSNPEFLENLDMILKASPSLKGKLLFEVTESSRVRDLEKANEFIQRLREDGFPVCLDDFGAGESAFEYLRALDVDYVKIDGSYIDQAMHDRKGRAFLVAMVQFCQSLQIDTIAERIEDKEMAQFLLNCGVPYGQGYYYGKPSADAPLMLA